MNIIRQFFLFLTKSSPARVAVPALAPDSRFAWRQRELAGLYEAGSVERLRHYTHHPDGFVRQAAVERAAGMALPGLPALLVERLNDWVPKVRLAARYALSQALPLADAADIIAALPAVQRLDQARREQHAAWIAEFEASVFAMVGTDALLQAVRVAPVQVARAAFRLLARVDTIDPALLYRAIVPASRDVVLATWAFDHLAARGEPDEEMLVRAFRSRVAPNRAKALRALIARGATVYADEALFARQSQLRSIAASFLAQQGTDVGALYAQALREPVQQERRIVICLVELGRLKRRDALDDVRTWLGDASPSIRVAAAQCWLQLAPQAKDEVAAYLLADPVRRVRAVAMTLIRRYGAYVPFKQARALLDAHGDTEQLLTLAALDPWNWLETIARLATEQATDRQRMLRLQEELCRWLARSSNAWARLGSEQRERLALLLQGRALQPLTASASQSWREQWRHVLAQAGLSDV
ncbi:hypothetical protein G4G28_03525 [Massilia sp. Dwa41.01b]|uniref:hypothetical protein n=1 Tax=unclassified Massilia TaxID=2609279 RepID=UPI00160445D1|nr:MULTISPECIES: hypothetical protein [unclassified Massilia]QNA87770.1 hypothetical protein G4G28_03525 [Massilia sp. Dwa41.01b]QNA98674.1 hypothetical protein G4G31_07250 [Massilia sp. Se16.2.3]